MSRIDNLKPFRPGQSGNPKGRPKGTVGLTNILREALNNSKYSVVEGELLNDENEPTGTMVKIRAKYPTVKNIVSTVLNLAKNGNMRAIEFIFDRIEGKPSQNINTNLNTRVPDKVEFTEEEKKKEIKRLLKRLNLE